MVPSGAAVYGPVCDVPFSSIELAPDASIVLELFPLPYFPLCMGAAPPGWTKLRRAAINPASGSGTRHTSGRVKPIDLIAVVYHIAIRKNWKQNILDWMKQSAAEYNSPDFGVKRNNQAVLILNRKSRTLCVNANCFFGLQNHGRNGPAYRPTIVVSQDKQINQ
jgi:hypothetical protein